MALFGARAQTVPCLDFRGAFDAVDRGTATHAVVPVENSIEGTVAQVNDLLFEHDLTITREIHIAVNHCLLGNPGARLGTLRAVYSHPQALGQCREFLARHPAWRQIPSHDTAGSAKMVRARHRKDEAAIASRRSARLYGLRILAGHLQTDRENTTRFFVLEKHPGDVVDADKTSVAFVAKNVPGSLHACLGEFASRGINLTKLESRPRRSQPWSYVFFADLEGSSRDPNVRAALGSLAAVAGSAKVLGSYHRADPPARSM